LGHVLGPSIFFLGFVFWPHSKSKNNVQNHLEFQIGLHLSPIENLGNLGHQKQAWSFPPQALNVYSSHFVHVLNA